MKGDGDSASDQSDSEPPKIHTRSKRKEIASLGSSTCTGDPKSPVTVLEYASIDEISSIVCRRVNAAPTKPREAKAERTCSHCFAASFSRELRGVSPGHPTAWSAVAITSVQ